MSYERDRLHKEMQAIREKMDANRQDLEANIKAQRESGQAVAEMLKFGTSKITVGAITTDKITPMSWYPAGLSPADQHLISTLENGHVTLVEFQRRHGLEPDGLMGPRTREVMADLSYRRRNNEDLDRLVDTIPSRRRAVVVPCRAGTYVDENGTRYVVLCDKGNHDERAPHGGTHHNARLRWRTGETFVRPPYGGVIEKRPAAITPPTFAYAVVGETRQEPLREALKTRAATNSFATKTRVPMTKEAYQRRFSEMEYTVIRCVRFGFRVVVTLAQGDKWEYWRPTRTWADRTGTKRLKRELSKLDVIYNTDNPQGVRARDLGIHPQITSEELTAQLAEQEAAERKRAQAEWDAQFKGEEKAS